HQWDPLASDGARAGARAVFGVEADVQYRFDRADVIVALDADFLGGGPRQVRAIRDFASRRRPGTDVEMNRLYVVESTPPATGARADHRLPLAAAEVELLTWLLAGELEALPQKPIVQPPPYAEWVRAVAKDLTAHRGSSVVVAGDHQSPAVHALAYV